MWASPEIVLVMQWVHNRLVGWLEFSVPFQHKYDNTVTISAQQTGNFVRVNWSECIWLSDLITERSESEILCRKIPTTLNSIVIYCTKQNSQYTATNYAQKTRHRASTSIYSLTLRVRGTTPPHYGRNGTAHAAGASILSPARGVFAGMRSVPAACSGPGGLPLGSATHFHSVAIATQPVHRLQIGPTVQN